MSILVDHPLWTFRGEKWSHLVSDLSYDELHEFAGGIGVRRLAFQGDHYDLPARLLPDVLKAGAIHTESRELVRKLRGAGLRKTRGAPKWEPLVRLGTGATVEELDAALSSIADHSTQGAALAHQVVGLWRDLGSPIHRVFALHRPDELALAFDTDHGVDIDSNGPASVWVTTTTDCQAVDLILTTPARATA